MPFITDNGEHQGKPYFSRRKIDLGGGMSPGGLRVEARVKGESCQWEIKATYQGGSQPAREVTLRDGDEPFLAEAMPTEPEQFWVLDVGRQQGEPTFAACHETRSHYACPGGA